jgi:hypothetical protein
MQPRLFKLLTASVVVTAYAAGSMAFAGPGRAGPAVASVPSMITYFPASADHLTRDYDACCSTRTVCVTRRSSAGWTSWRAPVPSRCVSARAGR